MRDDFLEEGLRLGWITEELPTNSFQESHEAQIIQVIFATLSEIATIEVSVGCKKSNDRTFPCFHFLLLLLDETKYVLRQFMRFAYDVEAIPNIHHFYGGQYKVSLFQKPLRF